MLVVVAGRLGLPEVERLFGAGNELARARRVPFLKAGRRTLFDPELLREWIARQTVPPRG